MASFKKSGKNQSQVKPAPSQSSSGLPGLTSFVPSRKLPAKKSLLKLKASPPPVEAKHLTTLGFHLLTDLQIKTRIKAFTSSDSIRHSIFTAQFSERLASPINKSVTLNNLQILKRLKVLRYIYFKKKIARLVSVTCSKSKSFGTFF